mmetsp:Transcript_32778/g.37476  ORF Transcript_32778/g.37476 Transcript_32778/m.37476 type:complete len:104 (+) Transcript_32778:1543-1854(+)
MYDFTVRSRVTNFFVFKIAKPVKIYANYFGTDEDDEINANMEDMKYLFIPDQHKNFTIYDTTTEQKRKRQENEHFFSSFASEDSSSCRRDTCDSLLMSRENHL